MPARRPRHWTYAEERIRGAVLVRDNYECQIRGPSCQLVATTVDHIHPKAWGGLATPTNLRAACWPCNQAKGARAAPIGFFKPVEQRRGPLPNLPPFKDRTSSWTIKPVDFGRKSVENQ